MARADQTAAELNRVGQNESRIRLFGKKIAAKRALSTRPGRRAQRDRRFP